MGTINDYPPLVFKLEADQVNLRMADVFDAVRRQAFDPRSRGQGVRELPAIEQNVSLTVAADKVAEADRVIDSGPAVSVNRNRIANRDASVQYAHPFILKEQRMVFRRRDDGVEFGWPAPGFLHLASGLSSINHPWESGCLADMLQSAHPRDETLDTHAESRVRNAAVLAKIQVPFESLAGEFVLFQPL